MIEINLGATACPNRCRHCWIFGGETHAREEYATEQLWWVLDGFQRSGGSFRLGLGAEETYHPHFVEYYERVNRTPAFESVAVIVTNGWGLARDPAAAPRLHRCGIRYARFTVYGTESSHDCFAEREGAYDDIMVAASRARAAGIRVSWNILIHKANIDEIPGVLSAVAGFRENFSPVLMEPTGRAGALEHLTPGASDLKRLPEALRDRLQLTDLNHIECGGCLESPCFFLTPSMDVHFSIWMSGAFGVREASKLGNLRENSIVEIAERVQSNPTYVALTERSLHELADMYAGPGDEYSGSCWLHRKWLRQWSASRGDSLADVPPASVLALRATADSQ